MSRDLASSTQRKSWLADMKQWRELKLAEMNYNGAEYDRPELKWCQSAFVQPQMMVEDRYFFDVETGQIHGGPLPG